MEISGWLILITIYTYNEHQAVHLLFDHEELPSTTNRHHLDAKQTRDRAISSNIQSLTTEVAASAEITASTEVATAIVATAIIAPSIITASTSTEIAAVI